MQPNADEVKWYAWILNSLFVILAGAVGAGAAMQKFKGRIDKVEARQGESERAIIALNGDIKTRLYYADGGQIYVPIASCEKMQANCAAKEGIHRVEGQLDQVERKLDDLIKSLIPKAKG